MYVKTGITYDGELYNPDGKLIRMVQWLHMAAHSICTVLVSAACQPGGATPLLACFYHL